MAAQGMTSGDAPGFALPLTTVDLVIFTVLEGHLQLLLVERPDTSGEPCPGQWALPGGFVDVLKDDSLISCARRKLFEKTGVKSPYLEQLGSWGSRTRDPRGWSSTHVYFALIPAKGVELKTGGNARAVAWRPVDELDSGSPLAFDHDEIAQAALRRLRDKVEYTSLPAFLLVEPFTLPQLQSMYEVVLGRPLDKSAFRTRMLAAGFLQEAGFLAGQSNRPAMGYRLLDRNKTAIFPRTFSPRSGAPPDNEG
jgi:8-oxo-dGTP diphosphatase